MHTGWRGGHASAVAVLALTALAAGCQEDGNKKTGAADAGAEDAGPAQPVIGGKLGAAVAAAASGSPSAPSADGAGENGPPEGGVFTLAAAAAALPKELPYKIDVIADGGEPRVKLAPRIDFKSEQKVDVNLGLRMGGPQGLPNLDLALSLKAEKPKEGSASAATITAKINAATLASMSLGGPPKELTEVIGKLKGSSVRYALSAQNVPSGFQVELAKGADPGLAPVVAALGEVIGILTPPLPDKPVGPGATWMITDRAVASGAALPMLRYRAYRVEKIEGDVVSFGVDIRQYAEGADMKVPSPRGEMTLTIDRFDASGKGSLTWSPSGFAPGTAELSQRLQALLMPPGGQQTGQRSVAAVELSARFGAPAAAR